MSQVISYHQKWFDDVSRLRHVQYGSRSGRLLHIDKPPDRGGRDVEGAALACDARPLADLIRLQGLPDGFSLPGFTVEGAKKAVGNGVPLPMGRRLAAAIVEAYSRPSVQLQRMLDPIVDAEAEPAGRCACGCGRRVAAAAHYYD